MGHGMFMRKGKIRNAPVVAMPTLNDNSWETIRKKADNGEAASIWSVGDTKTITINGKVGATTFTNLEVEAFIIGFNHNSELEGENRIHFQIGRINGVNIALVDSYHNTSTNVVGAFTMNNTNTNYGGWASCVMRKTVLGSDSNPLTPTENTLLSALPLDLRNVMKPVTKYTDNVGNESRNSQIQCCTATTEYLPLLAEFEYFGVWTHAYGQEPNFQQQYDYYKTAGRTAKFKHNDLSVGTTFYTRSPRTNDRYMFCIGNDAGYANISYANNAMGVSPMFVI